jgi:WD40 repeat protein/predicted MPP superfamily phosphohydrolase
VVTKVSWLHLSDLQIGPKGSRWLQADVREEFERDLRRIHKRAGPWDLVFITGDLTQTGSEQEFELLDSALESFWGYLRSLGSNPALLTVPGNHDLVRGPIGLILNERLHMWHDLHGRRETPWKNTEDPLQRAVYQGFKAYSQWAARWRSTHALPPGLSVRSGLLPGDFSARFETNDARARIVGLNSAFLQLSDRVPKGSLDLDDEQVLYVSLLEEKQGAGARDDLLLLLTHHPFSWIPEARRDRVLRYLDSKEAAIVHLCGSLRGPDSFIQTSSDWRWSDRLLTLQAPSLFASGPSDRRLCGYGAASIEIDGLEGEIRVWSRTATQSPSGEVMLGPAGESVLDLKHFASRDRTSSANSLPPHDEGTGAPFRPNQPSSPRSPTSRGLTPSSSPALVAKTRSTDDGHALGASGLSVPLRQSPLPTLARPPASVHGGPGVAGLTPEEAPAGLRLRASLAEGRHPILSVAWSLDGSRLATGTSHGRIDVRDIAAGTSLWLSSEPRGAIVALAWSPNDKALGSYSHRHFSVWEGSGGSHLITREVSDAIGVCFAWSPDGSRLAFGQRDGSIKIFDAQSWEALLRQQNFPEGRTHSLAWSPDGQDLIAGTDDEPFLWVNSVEDWEVRSDILPGHHDAVLALAFQPKSNQIATASRDRTIRIWDAATRKLVVVLEGHTDAVSGVSFSFDGRLLASRGHDDTIRLWGTETWEQVAELREPVSRRWYSGVAFSPTEPVLAALGPSGKSMRLWDVDVDALARAATSTTTVHSSSAKVVLVGEASVGKTCLALRLAEDRYEEQGSTHGMRLWTLPIGPLGSPTGGSPRERREVVLWDLGGQSEYRLIHQLFLRHTAVALMLFDPRRGETALGEVEGWDAHFHAQAGDRRAPEKLLVGTKLDDEGAPLGRLAIDKLVGRLGFKAYLPTSARTGKGVDELKRALVDAIDWAELGQTSRPELFQKMRRQISLLRETRRVVLMFTELEDTIRRGNPQDFDPEALRAVVKHLATQGVIADTRLANGAQALVLEFEQVERYAGSLILLARENPRGVPAIDLSTLTLPTLQFPVIGPAERLPRDQELVVLDCVVELLIEHGICFRHEGLLVFPSLFQASGVDEGAGPPHAVSLSYSFSGATDNIYASLVASLAMSRPFGHPRLWENRAEFGRAGEGASGVRRVGRKGDAARGLSRLDLYFNEQVRPGVRELFVGFVKAHLRGCGVEPFEHLDVMCACGYEFSEPSVRKWLDKGRADVVCPDCNQRVALTPGAREESERGPELARELSELRETIKEDRKASVGETKVSLRRAREDGRGGQPIRVLHLSDLHIRGDQDVEAIFQPLRADLRDAQEGLSIDRLDYLVVSGDLTNRADPTEFERAREFVSALIEDFGLAAERCIIVPGNHDIDWKEKVYDLVEKDEVDHTALVQGNFVPAGDVGRLVRDDARYPGRFKNFSQHFYHSMLQQEYPLDAKRQCLPILGAAHRLQFLAMNSAFEIDKYFRTRSGIHPGALARGLDEADRQLKRAREGGQLDRDAEVLRLAVWHHPVSGGEKIVNDAFLENLRKARVRVCLHGHVHENRNDHLGYLHPTRSLHVVGAGSFGAPAYHRPESVPRLYNLMEIERDLGSIRVRTRCLKREGGAWEGLATWLPKEKGEGGSMCTYYDIDLKGAR